MTKYKVVGIISFFYGFVLLLILTVYAFNIMPRLFSLYSEVNTNYKPNLIGAYSVIFILLLMAMISLFLGVKGFRNKEEKYFKFGIIFLVAPFFLTGILVAILSMSVIAPLYNLTY